MRILFAGDSITKGEIGTDYTSLVSQQLHANKVLNLAKNGLTYNMIIRSLLEQLKQDKHYDLLILQGGYNDLLLPWFYERGGLFRFAYNTQLKKGMRPFDTSKHAFTYLQHTVQQIRNEFSGVIVLVGIGCLGENLELALNKKAREFNQLLEQIADRQGILLAKPELLFAEHLKGKTVSNYCLNSFFAVTLIDRITHYFASRRQLHLTIDGVHLDDAGAQLFASAILQAIDVKKG